MQEKHKNINQILKNYQKLNEALENVLEKLYQDAHNTNSEQKNDSKSFLKQENK